MFQVVLSGVEPRRGEERGDVRRRGPVEGLLESRELVAARDEQVEQGDHGALELGALPGVHRRGAEGLPADRLASRVTRVSYSLTYTNHEAF